MILVEIIYVPNRKIIKWDIYEDLWEFIDFTRALEPGDFFKSRLRENLKLGSGEISQKVGSAIRSGSGPGPGSGLGSASKPWTQDLTPGENNSGCEPKFIICLPAFKFSSVAIVKYTKGASIFCIES